MVVENPVTLVLYNQFPFVRLYRTLNVFIPAYGPQLIKILVGLILLESIIIGTVVIVGAIHSLVPVEEEELEVELEERVGPPAVPAAHVCFVTWVLLNVIAPAVFTRSLPLTVEPPLSVIADEASIFPTRLVDVPRVAAEPTCQYTLQAWAPLIRTTLLDDPVTSVESILKIKTESAFPW